MCCSDSCGFKGHGSLEERITKLKGERGLNMGSETKVAKKDLPDITEVDMDVTKTQATTAKIIDLMERGIDIKQTVGKAPDHKKGEEGSGLLLEYDQITERLLQIQNSTKQPGLRYGQIVFTSRMQDGRESLNTEKLKTRLLEKFVTVIPPELNVDILGLINQCFSDSTTQGDSYWVRELGILKTKS